MDSPLSARQGLDQLVALHKRGAECIRTQTESARLSGAGDSAYAALEIARLAESLPANRRPLVAVVRDETEARLLRRDLQFFLGGGHDEGGEFAESVLSLPDLDTSPWADVSPERSAILRRMSVLFRLSQGEAAWNSWLAALQNPWYIAFHLAALLALSYHTYTWFKIMPRTMPPLVVGGERLPGWVITAGGLGAAAAACLGLLALVWGITR